MTKFILSTIILAFTSMLNAQINFQDLTIDEAIAKAKSENKKVFIDVFTTWCGPCKWIDQNVFKKAEIGDRMNPDFVSIKVDAERYSDPARFAQFGVRAYPTMLVLDGDGKEIKRIIGSMSVEEFHTHLDAFIDPALLPQNIALKEMSENQKDEAVWRKSMAVLMKKDRMKFYDNCQTFVDQFGLNELNNELDSSIFYNAELPLESPVVQRLLSEKDYMPYSKETYQKLDLRERARTAKTKADYLAIVEEAKAAEEQRFIDFNGDYVTDQEFLESLDVENLNPVYLQKASEETNAETSDGKTERKKRKEEKRRNRKKKN